MKILKLENSEIKGIIQLLNKEERELEKLLRTNLSDSKIKEIQEEINDIKELSIKLSL